MWIAGSSPEIGPFLALLVYSLLLKKGPKEGEAVEGGTGDGGRRKKSTRGTEEPRKPTTSVSKSGLEPVLGCVAGMRVTATMQRVDGADMCRRANGTRVGNVCTTRISPALPPGIRSALTDHSPIHREAADLDFAESSRIPEAA
jgi:hypothetical protein